MKPNELRLGNLFIEENSNKIIEVIGLENNRVVFSWMFLDKWQARPIVLTAEWLLKFGSKPRFQNTEFIYNRFRIVFKESYGYWYVIDTDSLAYITKVEFVHEWQNFIFTLTDNELTLAE